MAVDKLVDSTQLDSDLTSVANAIRTKGGTSAQMAFPAGFVSAVQAIPTGITPTGTKQISITQNGTTTEDVAAYANAEITVNVQGGSGYSPDDIAMRFISGDINLTSATKIIEYTFAFSAITSLRSETVTEIRSNACSDCSQLSAVELPNCVNGFAGNQIFARCTNLVTVKMPKLNNLWSNAFDGCRSLQNVVFPAVARLNSFSFLNCTNLISADFSANINIANGGNFQGCTSLSVLVLRSSLICPLGYISSFTNSPFASGGAGGTLYVPSALISSYQSATNWSTILGYANNQILPIEGSIYETQYADGTPIT